MNPNDKPATPQELMHVGVKGMKWGVRKNRSSGGGGSAGSKPKKPELTPAEAMVRAQRRAHIKRVAVTATAIAGARFALRALTDGLETNTIDRSSPAFETYTVDPNFKPHFERSPSHGKQNYA